MTRRKLERIDLSTSASATMPMASIGAFAVLLVACTMISSPVVAASFACEKAASRVEKMICADPDLSQLDEHLGRYYAAARTTLAHADACLAVDQRNWLRTSRNACKDVACLKQKYLKRLAALDALQPGASSLRGVDLPREMPLVWIVPPALDEMAAPRDGPTRALTVRGTLRDESANGDGFVIQASSGDKHLILFLMFLESASTTALSDLARVPNAIYEARGQTDVTREGGMDFSPGRCTFVYRVAP